jgi:hypothetical protein
MVNDNFFAIQYLAEYGLPFVAYFVGIIIRKVVLPAADSPPLGHQCLLGVPISLVIVSPSLKILHNAINSDVGAYLFAIGIIMEHGMIVQETASKHLRNLLRKRAKKKPGDRTQPSR